MSTRLVLLFALLLPPATATLAQQKRAAPAPTTTPVRKKTPAVRKQAPAQAKTPTVAEASAANKQTTAQKAPPLKLLSSPAGKELVAGTQLPIRWQGGDAGGRVSVALLLEHPSVPGMMIPAELAKSAPNNGRFDYTLPIDLNSRFGYRYRVRIQEGEQKVTSDSFTVYPEVDLVPLNIKIRNKKTHWGLRTLRAIAIGGLGNFPGVTEVRGLVEAHEAVLYAKQDGKSVNHRDPIVIEFDLENRGIKIVQQKLMTKVTVRLDPGNAELAGGGFSHDKVIPGRKYHSKGTIKAKDFELAPGNYRLEISVDPQNNAHEPAALRKDNVKVVQFTVR